MQTARSVVAALCVALLSGLAISASAANANAETQADTETNTEANAEAQVLPGSVVSALPTSVYLDPFKKKKLSVNAWKILYQSTSVSGKPITVSGQVLVPEGDYAGVRPVIGYAPATHGLGDKCAPSVKMAQGKDPELALVKAALDQGWAVAITDYEGLGTPGNHTYMVGRSEGHAVLDAMRAAVRGKMFGLSPDAPMGIWGYSQGGAAATWAGEIQPTYAPELPLLGIAAGGVPADLSAVAAHLDGGSHAGYLVMSALGFRAAYPELPFYQYLNDEGTRAFEEYRDACSQDIVDGSAYHKLTDYTTTDVLAMPEWQARLHEQRLGMVPPAAPVYLYHASKDEIVPFSVAKRLRDRYCSMGVTVQWKKHSLVRHISGSVRGRKAAVHWLGDRFSGAPAGDDCT